MSDTSIMIPVVSSTKSSMDRFLMVLAILIFPATFLAGQRLFELMSRSW